MSAGERVAGVGARMAFAFAATHGAGRAIGRFSIAHHITGSGAWVAALVMMALADVLTRLAVVYLRGRRLATAPDAHPGRHPRLISYPGPPQPDHACEGTAGRGGPYSLAPQARAGSPCCRGQQGRTRPSWEPGEAGTG